MAETQGSRLARARKKKGLSQQQLGALIGSHWVSISKLERGKANITYEWATKISLALDVPVSDLFEYSDNIKYVAASGAINDKGAVYEWPGGGTYSMNSAMFSEKDAYWLIIDTDDFYPLFHVGDIIKFVDVDENQIEVCVDRLCLVKEDESGAQKVGFVGHGPRKGDLRLRLPGGSPIPFGSFAIIACATTTFFQGLGEGPDGPTFKLKAAEDAET